jgi:rhodanese-related sulfurtransferase
MKCFKKFKHIPVNLFCIALLLGCTREWDNRFDPISNPSIVIPVNEFDLVSDIGDIYVQDYTSASGSAVNISMDWLYTILTGSGTENEIFIIDFRAAADFDVRHIKGAVNIVLSDLINKVNDGTIPEDKTIICVCYTGQTGSIATSVLNLLGFNAQNLTYGMCGVTTDTDLVPNSDVWINKVESSNWYILDKTDEGNPSITYNFPEIDTGKKTAVDIIKARYDKVWDWNGDGTADWGMGVSALPDDVSNYFTVNYWSAGEYLNPGHIEGAYQFTPKNDFLTTERLNELPTDQKIAVYCYTGQTSAQMTAYLRLIGYEAYSVTYGVNGFSYDQMTGVKYVTPYADYTAVLEPAP